MEDTEKIEGQSIISELRFEDIGKCFPLVERRLFQTHVSKDWRFR